MLNKNDASRYSVKKIIGKLQTHESGLETYEAERRVKSYGENIYEKNKNTTFKILLRQFKSYLVYLFIIAAILSFFLKDFTDGIIITIILFLNAALGFFQEYRSERAVEKLLKFISHKILVIRSGNTQIIEEKTLVPGDIVILREGDIVPADIKIIELKNLLVNESQLTGESAPVTKEIGNGDSSLLLTGSIIEKGEAKGVVYSTGNNTELGKIAKLSAETKKVTQYEKSLSDLSRFLIQIVLITLAVIFVGKLLINPDFSNITTLFLFIIALAVTVIPEALPVIATVTLSEGALELARKSVVVKRLSSLEDLGNVDLLATDKTGTLTENKLTIKKVISENNEMFLKFAYASIENRGLRKKKFESSYDLAFEDYISREIKEKVKNWKQVIELPFDPTVRRRRMVIEDEKSQHFLVEVGAAETLINISKTSDKKKYLQDIKLRGREGIRHLAISYKKISYTRKFDILENENNLIFLGYIELIDPIRISAKPTIELAEKLGLTIKILTGDSREVAQYIGREIGFLGPNDVAITGDEIDKISAQEFKNTIEKYKIFARVTPEQKYKIIEALKENHVVGYQGDGINDAPSLKLSDVSIAVDTATDVAKESSDIVLLKKDLGVIVNGIRYGRSVFVNIGKYIKHTMIGNFGTFFSLAIVYLFARDLPQLPIQLLLGNLIQDIPLVTIYSDNVDVGEVSRPEKYDIRGVIIISLFLGTFTAIYDFIFFRIIGFRASALAESSIFLFLTLTQLSIIFSVRNKSHMWQGEKPSRLVVGSIVLFSALSLLTIYIYPLSHLFSFSALPMRSLSFIVSASLIFIFILDYIKVLYFKAREHPEEKSQK